MSPEEQEVQALYDRGLYLRAYAGAAAIAPLRRWRGAQSRVLAGRLALRLGGTRLGEAQLLAALREPDAGAQALYFAAASRMRRKGVWVAWRMLERYHAPNDTDAAVRSDLLAMQAHVAAILRDFDLAERLMREAEAMSTNAWLALEHASVLEQQDRYEEALAMARSALARDSHRAGAVMLTSHLLQLLAREGEAEALLREELEHLECADLAAMLALILEERGAFEEALAELARYESLAPLLDAKGRPWLAMRRTDLLVHLGRHDEAAAQAEASGSPFHVQMAARAATGSGTRIVLPVPFVRQHHKTCGPATLTALAIFHGRPTEHLRVADDICYGGTTEVNERRWALRNGFAVREFTLNAGDARALLGRGLPFAVATHDVANGHVQAVMGIDERRGTFVVRDPFIRHTGEWLIEEFLSRFRASGPRAMVLVPNEDAFTGLALQDADLYDLYFRVQDALARHDHAAARAACAELAARDEDHRLAIEARCALCFYERDPIGALSCVLRLLEQHPDDGPLTLRKLGCLWEVESREARLEVLRGLVHRPSPHPAFVLQLAWTLHADAGAADEVLALCERALRASPTDAQGHRLRGQQLLQRDRADEALQSLRFASCLDETNGALAFEYFEACRSRGHAAEALALLQKRFARDRHKSAEPAKTLFRAFEALHRHEDAFAVLEQALVSRPDDGELLLFAAEVHAGHGRLAAAHACLDAAAGRANEAARLQVSALLAARDGDLLRARECWQQSLLRKPLDEQARAALVRLLRASDGVDAALAHLREAAGEFPYHRPTRRMLAVELSTVDPEAAEQVLVELAESDPLDAWVQRELALRRLDRGRHAEALAAADVAMRLSPHHATCHGIRGFVLEKMGRTEEARACFLRALELDVDYTFAIGRFVFGHTTLAGQQGALAQVESLLEARPGAGLAVASFAECARRLLAPGEVLARLRELLQRHPESWAAQAAVVQQLVAMQRSDEAMQAARPVCDRFPLLPRSWLDLAAAHRLAGSAAGEEEALERARELLPWSTEACRRLAVLWCKRGEAGRAAELLRDALARAPEDNPLRLQLCEVLMQHGDLEAASALASAAIDLDPTDESAWRVLGAIAQRRGDPQLIERVGRSVAERRAVPDVWLRFASALTDPALRLQALARCLALDRSHQEALDLRAELLAELGRAGEALAQLDAPEPSLSVPLRGRRAWLLAKLGRRQDAMQAMREVVAADPSYSWGRMQMIEWLSADGHQAEAIEAARELVAASPQKGVAHGFLGDALLEAGRQNEALAAFERALDLSPRYEFAARHLIDGYLKTGELERAERVVDRWLAHQCDAPGLLWRITVAQRRAAEKPWLRDAVLAAWTELCREPTAGEAHFAAALRETPSKGGFLREVSALLEREAARDGASPPVAATWLQSLCRVSDVRAAIRALEQLEPRAPLWHAGAQAVLDHLGSGSGSLRRRRRTLRRLLRTFPDARWREDDLTWGSVLYAMVALGSPEVIAFAHDWEARPSAPPWTLANVATALRNARRWQDARAVNLAAVARPPDHASWRHHLWLAVEALVAGDAAAAGEHVTRVDRTQVDDEDARLLDVVQAWQAFVAARSSETLAPLRSALRALSRTVRATGTSLSVRLCWPRLVRAAARDCGVGRGPWRWLWLRLRWMRGARAGRSLP